MNALGKIGEREREREGGVNRKKGKEKKGERSVKSVAWMKAKHDVERKVQQDRIARDRIILTNLQVVLIKILFKQT